MKLLSKQLFSLIITLLITIPTQTNQSNLALKTQSHSRAHSRSKSHLTTAASLQNTSHTNDADPDPQLTKEQIEENLKKIHKVLFMVKLPENLNSENQLNFVNYKNMVVSHNQVSFFISDRNNNAEKDTNPNITSYVYTINTSDIDLPCINRSFVCLYQELLGEYLKLFPEVNFNVPNEIVQYFGNKNKMMDKCIVLTNGPAVNIDSANWLCHPDAMYIKTVQALLSTKVRDTVKDDSLDLFVRYAYQGAFQDGILRLESDKAKFINLQKNIVFEKKYTELDSAAVSLYLKEDLPADLKNVIDDASRCFKLTELSPELKKYFCVMYSKTDQAMQKVLTVVESRWYALFYADYYTGKAGRNHARAALTLISKNSSSLEIDHSMLIAIKDQVRSEYLIKRHAIVESYKTNQTSKTSAMSQLKQLKETMIDSGCNGIEVCKKALTYCVDKGLLPLSGSREKFAMDPQNPYARKMQSQRIAVKNVVTGKGRDMVSQAASKKGSSSYFAEHLPAAAKGETPNFTNIKQAMNTFSSMKSGSSKKFTAISEFGGNCRQSFKTESSNIKRKVGLLNLVTQIDPFLQYLGYVHDKTLGKTN